ncbi:MAG TPA: glycogen debranching enzyme N-terminal domain-containing protein, partial [Candidatus Bathyarchaeia archaeon]
MKLPTININEEETSRLDKALHKEWLLTNGLGGYASSTILGLNTRKYHGLLVAALEPPGNRTVCLAKLDEDAIIGERIYPFNVNEFPDKIYPQGHLFQKSFSLAPFPTYNYEAETFRVSKTLFMPQGKNAAAVFYRIQGARAPSTLRIYPLLTCRHIHSVIENHNLEINQQSNISNVELTFNVP